MEQDRYIAPEDNCDILFDKNEKPVLNAFCKLSEFIFGKERTAPVDIYGADNQEAAKKFLPNLEILLPGDRKN